MPQVRGEDVVVLHENTTPRPGVLGGSNPAATTLVRYPDGEEGYVHPAVIRWTPEEIRDAGFC